MIAAAELIAVAELQMAKLCNNDFIITYYYFGFLLYFHYYPLLPTINVFESGQFVDVCLLEGSFFSLGCSSIACFYEAASLVSLFILPGISL